ncbi:DUF2927 domain-containing protein, partial [Falsiroseomonas oryzae]|uniref:DUF2927 domain-containing protein n=1 Tax=Falsiroseomonas oryzae TaxID=2766473 RepID=UPI0022EB0B51
GDAGTGAPARTRLQRFRMPMRIAVLGEDAPRYAPWVARHAAELARLTGQAIGVGGMAQANVPLVLSPDPARFLRSSAEAAPVRRMFAGRGAMEHLLAGLTPETGGLLSPGFPREGGHEITGGLVLVRTDRDPAMVWAAIVEELSQLLGLLGDDPAIGWSVFNDTSPYCDLTGLDRWLLRLLYQPGIAPGMTRAEAQRAALAAMRRLRPGDVAEGPGQPALEPDDAAVVDAFLRLAFADPGAMPGSRRTRL